MPQLTAISTTLTWICSINASYVQGQTTPYNSIIINILIDSVALEKVQSVQAKKEILRYQTPFKRIMSPLSNTTIKNLEN